MHVAEHVVGNEVFLCISAFVANPVRHEETFVHLIPRIGIGLQYTEEKDDNHQIEPNGLRDRGPAFQRRQDEEQGPADCDKKPGKGKIPQGNSREDDHNGKYEPE